jgi:outer membrane protein
MKRKFLIKRAPFFGKKNRTKRAGRLALILALALYVSFPVSADAGTGGGRLSALDLESFIKMVEENSLQLEIAEGERKIAESQERLAKTQLYPVIAGQLDYTRNFIDILQPMPVAAVPPTYELMYQDVDMNSDNELMLGLSLQQKLFDMNVFRGLDASSQYTELTAATYDMTRQATVSAAKRLFFQALLLQEVLKVRIISQEIAYENYLETKKRLESGVASPLEALQAEVSWKLTEPNTSQAEKDLNLVTANLRSFAGLPKDEQLRLEGSLEKMPPLPIFTPPAKVQGSRPDYRILQNERKLREINISVERSKFYPSVSASLTYGMQSGSDEFDFSDPADSLSAGISVTVPLFYGGSRFVSLNKAKLELEKTKTRIAQMESEISTELESIELSLKEANLRISSARQTLQTAEKAYAVSQTSVENGLATQLELKDARVSLEQARLGYLSAGFDYLNAYFDWQLATGAGAETLPLSAAD